MEPEDYDDTYEIDIQPSDYKLKFITIEDVHKVIEKKVEKIQELTKLEKDHCLLLLKYFKWNIEKLESDYFSDTQLYLIKSGVNPKTVHSQNMEEETNPKVCESCLGQSSVFDCLECKQKICTACWKLYIECKLDVPDNEVFIRCPFEGCNLYLPQSFIQKYIGDSATLQTRYKKFLGQSYSSESKTIKLCPAPGCNYAVENQDISINQIQCKCGFEFCFRCCQEFHEPCTCKMISDWNAKNSSESENIRWIRINTKPCPNCNQNIEKNNGCNHMTCRKPKGCGHEFCWLCLGPWTQHGDKTGGYYQCNKYNSMNEQQKQQIAEQINKEKNQLQKYIFYFERYQNHEKVQKKLKQILSKAEGQKEKYQQEQKCDLIELEFISEAILFLEKAKRCQKYTYCYGYYIEQMQLRELFEYSQGLFEQNCEILLELVEIELENILKLSITDEKFSQYKQKVNNYKNLTKNYMEKFVDFILNLS